MDCATEIKVTLRETFWSAGVSRDIGAVERNRFLRSEDCEGKERWLSS